MIDLRQFLNPYRKAKALHQIVGPKRFVAEGVFITSSGQVGMALSLAGLDFETASPEELDDARRTLQTALRVFRPGFTIYQYLMRRSGEAIATNAGDSWAAPRVDFLESDGLFTVELFMVVLFRESEGNRVISWLKALSLDASTQEIDGHLLDSIEVLRQSAETFAEVLKDSLGARVLNEAEVQAFLRGYLNPDPVIAARRSACAEDLDYTSTDTPIDIEPEDYAKWGEYHLRAMVLKDTPSRSLPEDLLRSPFLLRELQKSIESDMILCSEWTPQDMRQSVSGVKMRRRIRFGQTGVSPKKVGRQLNNLEAEDDVDDLGEAQRQMRAIRFGKFALTVLLFDKDAAKLRRSVASIRALHWDGSFIEETHRKMRLTAFLATIPGNSAWQIRRFWLSTVNYVDLSLIYRLGQGATANYLSLLETEDGTPYYLDLHHGQANRPQDQLAHTLILGAQRSGKTAFANQLIGDQQKRGGYTFVLDIGGSYRAICREFCGAYLSLDLERWNVRINPVAQLPIDALHQFVRTLILNENVPISSDQDQDLLLRLRSMAEYPRDLRRLSTLNQILCPGLAGSLHRWVDDGPYAQIFDNAEDTFDCARFQVFDFAGVKQNHPQALGPLMFYFFQRMESVVNYAPILDRPKMLFVDEGWSFISDALVSALKTWPKKNGAIVFIAQSLSDMKGDFLKVIGESCPNKFFFGSPGADVDLYGEEFGLNEKERLLIRSIIRPQMFLKTPTYSRLLRYRMEPKWRERYEQQQAQEVTA